MILCGNVSFGMGEGSWPVGGGGGGGWGGGDTGGRERQLQAKVICLRKLILF